MKTYSESGLNMVLILDSSFEIGAHASCILCYLICLWHLIRLRAVSNKISFLRKDLFSLMHAQHVLSNIDLNERDFNVLWFFSTKIWFLDCFTFFGDTENTHLSMDWEKSNEKDYILVVKPTPKYNHGTLIRWYLNSPCARNWCTMSIILLL